MGLGRAAVNSPGQDPHGLLEKLSLGDTSHLEISAAVRTNWDGATEGRGPHVAQMMCRTEDTATQC